MTTWAFNVIRELVASPDARLLWIEPASPDEAVFTREHGMVIGKCHHFSPTLAEAADIVVYSYRDLRTAAVSAYRKFGATGSREQLDTWIAVERLWLLHSDLVLRYENVEADPRKGLRQISDLLTGRGVAIAPESGDAILSRVDAAFSRREKASGPGFDARTLVLAGHRTFQPPVDALPEEERAMYRRVEEQFAGWLHSHGYMHGAAAPPPEPTADPLAGYLSALMRDIQSKEVEIGRLRVATSELEAVIREQGAALASRLQTIRTQDEDLQAAQRAHIEVTRMAQETERALEVASREIEKTARSLKEKEAVIQELDQAVKAYRAAPVTILGRTIRPIGLGINLYRRHVTPLFASMIASYVAPIVTPKLGVLHQHAPRELRVPPRHARSTAPARPPRISLVTPSFGQADFIERTIRSVLEQGYPSLEYYVQDGGSTDGTRAILERYADRLAGWDSRPDSGQSEAINRGFARTTGEIMAWLNSDDVLLPGTLAYVAEYFARHPEVDVVYGHRVLLDESDRQIGVWILPGHDDDVLSWADFVPQETMFWRRRIWEKAGGGIDQSFQFAMDWDLLVRFRRAGARFARLPRFLAGFRVHAQQKTSASITDVGFREMNLIRERELGRVPSKAEIRKAVRSYMVKHLLADFTWRVQDRLGFQS